MAQVNTLPENPWSTRYCTYEESVEREPNDISAKRYHHQPDLDVLHRHDQSAGDSLVLGVGVGLAHILNHPQLRDLALLLGESARVVGQVWEDEDSGEGNSLGSS